MASLCPVAKVILFLVRGRKILTKSSGDVAKGMFVERERGKPSILNPMNFALYKPDPGSLGFLAAEIKAGFYYTYTKR